LSAAESGLRDVLRVPDNYRILFLQGGATMQFSMVPMNLLPPGGSADYILTGYWGVKAADEAAKFGKVNVIYSGEKSGYSSVPEQADLRTSPDSAYIHYTSNETIDGVEFKYELDGFGTPVVCDASSNILSKQIDFEKYALIYAGAQKNIGPSGVTVVIIRDDLLERSSDSLPTLLNYRTIAENESMANTPNTWGIYMVGLVCDWLKEQGGVDAMKVKNEEKAALLYKAIDTSDGFYTGHAERNCRSVMNVTFRLSSAELDEMFCSEAESMGLDGLRGHRSVGGVRASIYNAFPRDGVEALVSFMKDFAARNG
ncbi:MAG TPA: 3-phosphoserine/phosphohydroxythreonine transaminase, partial [Pyrinomonadaceae bacterium]|nr:3-phosphoserine/phosphohydroxythreonine transaminase [Pyrinomonadaceae bacterium]